MKSISERYIEVISSITEDFMDTQKENILKAANMVADSIMKGGIIQTFGSGHSYEPALEIAGRAGGLIPSKILRDPSNGIYEKIEGVGDAFMKHVDIRGEDCIFVISNSGRNPLPIEVAKGAKDKGAKVIVLTSYEVSKTLTSKHSSGKMLYDYGDVILDNRGVEGDSAIAIDGLDVKSGATSAIIGSLMLNCVILESIEIMVSKGFNPPIFMSANIDGGPEFNQKLQEKYKDRLQRM